MIELIIAFIVISFFAALYVFLIAPSHDSEKMPTCLLTPYAHRGLHDEDTPENSLPAFEKASERGFGIELDIRLTKDGKVVVFHDDDLKRMCKSNATVADLTYKELSAFTLGESEEKIPLFEEVLSLKDGKVPLLIELKGTNGDTSLCDRAFELLDVYGGAFCIESFNPLLIGYVRRKRPEFIRGQLVTLLKKGDVNQPASVRFLLSHMLLNVTSRPHFIAFDVKKKPSLGIHIATSFLGAKKFGWTVRSLSDYKRLSSDGILSIFENFDPNREE